MAAHIRDRVTDAVVDLLRNLVTTGARVFEDRDTDPEPLEDGEIPGLVVNQKAPGSPVEYLGTKFPRTVRELFDIDIEGHTRGQSHTEVRRTANQIAQEVQTALGTDPLIGGLVTDSMLVNAEIETSGDTAKPGRMVRLTYRFEVTYPENAP